MIMRKAIFRSQTLLRRFSTIIDTDFVENKGPKDKEKKWNKFGQIGYFSSPHPAKVATGGEDAHSTSSDHCLITVADGVGGWGDQGIDSGIYSRFLCQS